MHEDDVPRHGTGADAIHRALDVLFYVAGSPKRIGVTDVGRGLGLPKSTVHRLLGVLCERGLLERDGSGTYQPGAALVGLGLRALRDDPLIGAVRPELGSLATELGETAFLVAARGRELRVLDKVEGSGLLRVAPTLGSTVPVHATAAGRLYLALAPDQLDAPPGRLPRHTGRTPSRRKDLADAVARAGERGWDANVDEWIDGMAVVSAPVMPGGVLAGVIALAGATPRMDALGIETVAERAREAADRASRRLTGGGA